MNIDAIDVRTYRLPLDPAFHASWDPQPRTVLASTIVRIRAGDFEGVGPGDSMPGFAGHEDLFLGRDVFDIERHVRVLDNLQFHYGRMWPVEIALWDLAGKIKGEPLWRMLGGTSPRVRVYASTGQRLEAAARVDAAVRLRGAGFPAIKLRFWHERPEDDIAIVRAVREALGPDIELLADANQAWRMPWDTSPSWDLDTAARVAGALADLKAYWLEEPLHRHAYDDLAALRKRSRVRIAGGEGNREYGDFEHYLAHGSLDVYQPDVAWSTGILRGRSSPPAYATPAPCTRPTPGAMASSCWPTCTSRPPSRMRPSSSSPTTRRNGRLSAATSSSLSRSSPTRKATSRSPTRRGWA